ncbi:hypothetical protein [Stieleria varia]|uniref:Uncharacterized protein n=1 Tax=Stieleria varia TaxID=2528005 RepID=A0A5C6A3N7_9BACT|nr:hypothetical protein [Stieleria varia]TWT94514.1 hypothetical protein Pla52n_53350 [Stieleria varia]
MSRFIHLRQHAVSNTASRWIRVAAAPLLVIQLLAITLLVIPLLLGVTSASLYAQDTPASEAVTESSDESQVEPEPATQTEPSTEQEPEPEPTTQPELQPELQPEPTTAQTAKKETDKQPLRIGLPLRASDGRPLHAIAVYQSQLTEMIPRGYRPVQMEQLADALTRHPEEINGENAGFFRRAFYDVHVDGDTLVSENSILEIETNQSGVLRRSLGTANFAVSAIRGRSLLAQGSFADSLPRMESDSQGQLFAVVSGVDPDSDSPQTAITPITMSWTLQGRRSNRLVDFDLLIPRSPQTRVVLSTSADMELETDDGVLSEMSDAPSDADLSMPARLESQSSQSLRWYTLDAGGMQRIRLRSRHRQTDRKGDLVIVRRQSRRYSIAPSGVTWSHRMTLQVPFARTLPPIRVPFGVITGVRVNAIESEFNQQMQPDGSSTVLVRAPLDPQTSNTDFVTLNVDGMSTWQIEDGACPLPKIELSQSDILYSQAATEARVEIAAPLSVVAWELPVDWQQEELEAGNGQTNTTLFATGPPERSGALIKPSELTIDARDGSQPQDSIQESQPTAPTQSWSLLRLSARRQWSTEETLLKLSVGNAEKDRVTDASVRIRLSVGTQSLAPLRFEVQRGWTLTSIVLPHSGRVIENPVVNTASQSFVFWPEPGDIDDSQLTILAKGLRRMGDENRVVVPSTWFFRSADGRGEFVAAISPPTQLKWSSETSMADGLVPRESLSDAQLTLLQPFSPDTLFARNALGDTPPVILLRPAVSLDVKTRLWLDRKDTECIETLSIQTDSARLPDSITVVSGPIDQRPDYQWSLVAADGSEAINVPPGDTQVSEDQGQRIYTIPLRDQSLRSYLLVGTRRYAAPTTMNLPLPGVRGAATQEAEAVIGSSWLIDDLDDTILKVPPIADDALELVDVQGFDQDRNWSTDATRLRYDPINQPAIQLSRPSRDPRVCLVWDEDINISASSRGTDSIRATYRVSSVRPIEITCDEDMILVSASRNGQAIQTQRSEHGSILIEPERDTDIIRLSWNRSTVESGWLRACTIPNVQVTGIRFNQRFRMTAASDTFAPCSLMGSVEMLSGGRTSLEVAPGTTRMLLDRNLAIGFGWFTAAIVFSVCWTLTRIWRHGFFCVSTSILVLAVAAVLWWPWQTAVIGWLVLPAVSACLLQASVRFHRRDEHVDEDAATTRNSKTTVRKPATDFSVSSPMTGILLLASLHVGAICGGQSAWAQQTTPSPDSEKAPLTVLVPVDADVQQVGDKVYVPNATYQSLFSGREVQKPADPFFQSANYRVEISSLPDPNEPAEITIGVEYLIQLNRVSNRVRLPFVATAVRRVELLQSDKSQVAQCDVEPDGTMIVNLPPASSFRLRMTLIPQVTFDGAVGKIRLAIPSIATSRLEIQSDRLIEVLSLGETSGFAKRRSDLGRWETDLGPAKEIAIGFQSNRFGDPEILQSFDRLYRVHADSQLTTIECEIDPTLAYRTGDRLELIILDNPSAMVANSAWSLQQTSIVSPARYSMTFEKMVDNDVPLSLIWQIPSVINDPTSEVDRITMTIPEISAANSSMQVARAVVGLSGDIDIRVAEMERDPVSAMATQTFASRWKGFRSAVDRAFVAGARIPPLILMRAIQPSPAVRQRQHLHITSQDMQLTLEAELVDPSESVRRRSVELPPGITVQDVKINETPFKHVTTTQDGRTILPLGDRRIGGVTKISVRGTLPLPLGKNFQTPRMRLLPDAEGPSEYLVTRQSEVAVRVSQSPSRPLPTDAQTDELLRRGKIPVLRWEFSADSDASSLNISAVSDADETQHNTLQTATLSVSKRANRFRSDQVIAMRFDQGRWTVDTAVRFVGRTPDFVDLEIPSRWCNQLSVSPETRWMLRRSIDPSKQVLRIACDPKVLTNQSLIVHGELDNTDQTRISVPTIRVLGDGQRSVFVSVPDRLTNEPINWRRSAVTPKQIPEDWRQSLSDTNAQLAISDDTYVAETNSWAVDLLPLSQTTVDPIALSSDAVIYAHDDSVLVVHRWDIVPEREDSVRILLPANSQCQAAWAGDRCVEFFVADAEQTEADSNEVALGSGQQLITVPLTLSRLTQSVEILLRVPLGPTSLDDFLPTLVDIPSPPSWMVVYRHESTDQTGDSKRSGDAETNPVKAMMDKRSLVLAQSTLSAIERSLDSVAERRNDEVALWIRPWIARYISLAESAGHRCRFEKQESPASTEGEVVQPTESSTSSEGNAKGTSIEGDLDWETMDQRMAVFVQRFFPDVQRISPPHLASSRTAGFVVSGVWQTTDDVGPRLISQSRESENLRTLLSNALTLLMVSGAFLLLWPLRNRVDRMIVHPAFWLFLIGVAGMFVAPIPVAVGIMLVAVSLPTLHRFSRRHPI